MLFRLYNATNTFSRLMDATLSGLTLICLANLDEVIAFFRDWPGHLQHLQWVFTHLWQAGLKLNPDKCMLGCTSLFFLGHIVFTQGIQPDPCLLLAIQEIATPTDVKELKSYLGLVSYYRRFVPKFSKKTAPLNQLLQKGRPWAWIKGCQAAFEELKSQLLHPPITS